MKNNQLVFSALLLIVIQQKSYAQCSASITNIPHGNCANTDIELIASGAGTANGFTYQWTGPIGFTSSDQIINIYSAPASLSGTYKVIITNPSGCSAADSTVVLKNPVPLVYTGGQAGGCEGTTTSIYAQDFSGNYGPYTYFWDNGATTQAIAVGHSGGIYPAPACFMTNTYGCTAANNSTFLIYTFPSPPVPIVEALSATSFCDGGSVTLTTPSDPNLTYQWNKRTWIINGATNPSYTAKKSGNFSVTASNATSCRSNSNKIHITVFALPQATVTASGSLNICNGDSVILNANTGSGLSYQWKKHTQYINNATASSLKVKVYGNYRVIVTDQQGCSKTSSLVNVTSNCRLDNEIKTDSEIFSIYPNPSSGSFNIRSTLNDNTNVQLIITDMEGRKVMESTIKDISESLQVGETLPAGIYNVSLIKNDVMQNTRFIKTE